MQPLLKTDVKHTAYPGRFIQECGCQYDFVTDSTGHVDVQWLDICADHYKAGRR
jgi:hypothetical protein